MAEINDTQQMDDESSKNQDPSEDPELSATASVNPKATDTETKAETAPNSAKAGDTNPVEKDPLFEAQAEAARNKELLLRSLADFDNFRKRARRELTDAELRGREELLRELLPVFDNLERAVAHAGDATDVQSLINGIKMVIRQFVDTLSRLNIERIATVGEAFDPSVHEAIQHLETDTVPPGSIANEIQGGYRMQQRLIRPAMVVVAKAVVAKEETENAD